MNDQFSHADLPGPGARPLRATAAPLEDPILEADEEGFDIDFQAIWSILYRNRFIIISIIVLALLAGQIITMLTTPTYQASTSVQIEQQATKVLESQDVEPLLGNQDTERFLQTQLDIIRSRSPCRAPSARASNLFGNDNFLDRDGHGVPVGRAPPAVSMRSPARSGGKRCCALLDEEHLGRSCRATRGWPTISFDSPDPTTRGAHREQLSRENFITSGTSSANIDASSYARNFLQQQLVEVKQAEARGFGAGEHRLRPVGARLIDASNGAMGADAGPSSGAAFAGDVEPHPDQQLAIRRRHAPARVQPRSSAGTQARVTPVMSLPEVLRATTAVQELVEATRRPCSASYEQQASAAARTTIRRMLPVWPPRSAELDAQIGKPRRRW